MTFALVGGPLGCLGIALLLAAHRRWLRLVALPLVGVGAALLGAAVAPSGEGTLVAGAIVVAAGFSIVVAVALRRWPWVLAFGTLLLVPVRIPITVGSEHSRVCLPLYILALGAGIQIFLATLAGERRSRELGPLGLPLAGLVLWTGLSLLWSNDRQVGAMQLLAYYLPFGLITVGLARLPWSRRAFRRLGVELVVMAVAFSAVGLYQYQTHGVFWNPKVIVDDAYEPFYRVNSVFWDPSIYGRFLMVAIIALLVVIVQGRSARLALAAVGGVVLIWSGLAVSYSQSSFTGLSVAVLILLAVTWRRSALIAVLVMTVILFSTGVASPNTRSVFLSRTEGGLNRATSNRTGLIYNGLHVAVHHPVVGVGVGGFRHAFAALTHLKGKEPKKAASHDTPVTLAVEGGLVSLALYGWLLVALFSALFRRLGATFDNRIVLTISLGSAAVIVHSLFYDNFFSDPTTWGLLGLAGLAISTVGRPEATFPEPPAEELPIGALLRAARADQPSRTTIASR